VYILGWRFGIASDIGGREEQQDRADIFAAKSGEAYLVVLADGMGGHHGGALAAQAVLDAARQQFESAGIDEPMAALEQYCLHAHQAVSAIGEEEEQSPGSTCVLLYLSADEAYWAHVGDSRLYHFRNGKLLNHTVDHSLVQLLVSQGDMTENEMADSPLQNQLYMRLGAEETPKPTLGAADVQAGDAFMLCSDGFWESVDEQEVSAILFDDDLEQGVEKLVKLARQRGGDGGDNITMVIAQMGKAQRQNGWFSKLFK
jgi:serine/threonine protein phosphatase PrpC